MKELTAYVIDGHDVQIRPAPAERRWMDSSNRRFAYRCLPLAIANTHGWEILCTAGFTASWDGRQSKDAITIKATAPYPPVQAISHFGEGVLTIHVPCLFQTDSGVDLYLTGPVNRPKDGIAALTGIIETDWSPYTFTMNWLFTRPHHEVRFEVGEPICHLFPVRRGQLEDLSPAVRKLSEHPELEREHRLWSASRSSFNADLNVPDSKATQDQWQKSYFRGVSPSGQSAPEGHRSRLRLRQFKTEP
ncbi:DUF6065 family protein [Bradyrhizobium diversitatis]|uniref:Uncharacterized protein n=1 Tax=Bradyrhizobium diversitatis TaxID=2755406 RepID=A0ABS0PET0_9BRAD|nr:DUF6065 family protein [Bradyrhizobium diversitatis]MBH5391746.1 hypothetical protein [Bradyrhizobium diversitatis]